MITRYFQINPDNVKGFKADLFSDHDFLPISNLKIIPGPLLENGLQLVKAELPRYLVKVMCDNCADFGIKDPLTPEGVVALDIVGSYAGETREEVLQRFPELQGTVKVGVDEDGNDIYEDKFPIMMWSGEKYQ